MKLFQHRRKISTETRLGHVFFICKLILIVRRPY
jgi:hypothetical protein